MKIDSAQIVGQALGLRGSPGPVLRSRLRALGWEDGALRERRRPRACPTPTLELE